MTGIRGRRRRPVLDDLNERKGHCKLKEGALDHILWKTRFGRNYRPVARQTNVE